MTIDNLIAICEGEVKRAEKTSGHVEFDLGYKVAFEKCLECARKIKISMLETEQNKK